MGNRLLCEMCNFSTDSQMSLKNHRALTCSDSVFTKFQCDFCPFQSQATRMIRSHIEREHSTIPKPSPKLNSQHFPKISSDSDRINAIHFQDCSDVWSRLIFRFLSVGSTFTILRTLNRCPLSIVDIEDESRYYRVFLAELFYYYFWRPNDGKTVLNVKSKQIQDKNNSIEFNVIGTKTYYDINVRVKPWYACLKCLSLQSFRQSIVNQFGSKMNWVTK